MADYIQHDDKRRAKNLKNFHGKTPKEIKETRWYHGTDQDFSEFIPREASAIYVTPDPKFASEWSEDLKRGYDPNVMPLHVRAEKPFDYQNKKHINNLIEILGPKLINDPELRDVMDGVREGYWESIEDSEIQNAIRFLGHDSFFVRERGGDDNPVKNLAVYEPSQVKSATGNQGTFDPSHPDITKAGGGEVDGITAYHGSPHDFDQFDISKIGTGEGAQAFGHGLYFAQSEPVAKSYAEELTTNPVVNSALQSGQFDDDPSFRAAASVRYLGGEKKALETLKSNPDTQRTRENIAAILDGSYKKHLFPKGHMYEVNIDAHPDHFLDWDKPLQEQPHVMQKLVEAGALKPDGELSFMYNESPRHGGEMYQRLTSPMASKLTGGKSQQHASDFLHGIGIKGIKYFDQQSRKEGEGSRNYVVFDDKLVNVKRKYAQGGMVSE
jgi:hypothetical protein